MSSVKRIRVTRKNQALDNQSNTSAPTRIRAYLTTSYSSKYRSKRHQRHNNHFSKSAIISSALDKSMHPIIECSRVCTSRCCIETYLFRTPRVEPFRAWRRACEVMCGVKMLIVESFSHSFLCFVITGIHFKALNTLGIRVYEVTNGQLDCLSRLIVFIPPLDPWVLLHL